MWKRVAVAGAVVVLAAGGWVVASRWNDARLAACERHGDELASIDLLSRQPTGFRPGEPAAGCDVDRVVAYASRQFIAMTGAAVDQLAGRSAADLDQPAVLTYYRQALADGGWQIAVRPPTAGPDAASLCASRSGEDGTTYMNLSFPFAGAYEVAVADNIDSGARCA